MGWGGWPKRLCRPLQGLALLLWEKEPLEDFEQSSDVIRLTF